MQLLSIQTHKPKLSRICSSGFTLIELIMVIVLLGIIGGMGSEFIAKAMQGFSATEKRLEIYEEGKIALVRLEREIHHSLPNAISIPVADGSIIDLGLIDERKMEDVFGSYIEVNPTGATVITDNIGALPLTGPAIGDLISIYTTSWTNFSSGARIYQVVNVAAYPAITLDTNILISSPYRRFFQIKDVAVRFHIQGGNLYRSTQNVTTAGTSGVFATNYVLARNVSQAGSLPYFQYTAGSSEKEARVAVHFLITKGSETIQFHKEIQIGNVP